jgi:hypothetical protein
MNSFTLVHLFHIIFVGGLFLYIGIKKDNTYKPILYSLLYLGILIILYHLYKIYNYIKMKKTIWVNLIHVFIIGPLLIYIGINRENTSRKYFELLLMFGFAAIGYHLFYLFQ